MWVSAADAQGLECQIDHLDLRQPAEEAVDGPGPDHRTGVGALGADVGDLQPAGGLDGPVEEDPEVLHEVVVLRAVDQLEVVALVERYPPERSAGLDEARGLGAHADA